RRVIDMDQKPSRTPSAHAGGIVDRDLRQMHIALRCTDPPACPHGTASVFPASRLTRVNAESGIWVER
ncbi:hypothetical protein RM530_15670, partial [Algiphilus sp. W345]